MCNDVMKKESPSLAAFEAVMDNYEIRMNAGGDTYHILSTYVDDSGVLWIDIEQE